MSWVKLLSNFQDALKIGDDEFEDLQSLYQLFDLDRDGILNFKEYEKLLRCLGYRLNGKPWYTQQRLIWLSFHACVFCCILEEQARILAKTVSVDKTNCSVSFNEFLKLMSVQQEAEPDHETLVDVFA